MSAPVITGQDSLATRRTLSVGGTDYAYYSLAAAAEAGLQDFTGVPAVVDLAAMRDAMDDAGRRSPRSTRCRRSIW